MPKDLLIEVGTEPMPARFLGSAVSQLEQKLSAAFSAERLGFSKVSSFATLRRLAVLVEGVAEKSESREEAVKGPPERLLKDAQGRFTPQAEGFARKNGIAAESLRAKDGYLYADVKSGGRPAAEIVAGALPEILRGIEFPKSLEWEESHFRFGRPVRSLVVLLGKNVVKVSLAGVSSGKHLRGLASLGEKPFVLAEPKRYAAALRDKLVLVAFEERKKALLTRLAVAARQAGGKLDLDEGLVEETVWMTEQPNPVVGKFRPAFLSLPQPLLAMVLKKQLKFFPVLADRSLLAAFVGVRDGVSEGQALVREGFQRVLEARLNDAVFFFERDKKARLEDRLSALSRVTYQKSLGSMAEKAQRVGKMAAWLCESLRQDLELKEAAVAEISRLAYADLVCEVVKEFPELQGTMGGVYARHDGLDERVALGLEQFYFPLSGRSPVPTTFEGAVASLAGKLDSLAGHFAIGNVPTGSADPFALRRQALGVVRILLEKQLPLDLEAALDQALSLQPASAGGEARKLLGEFVWARAQNLFEEMGHRVDEIRAVREASLTNLPRTLKRLAAVHAVRQHPDFEALAAAFKRASNILKQARSAQASPAPTEAALLKEEAELAFHQALTKVEGQAREKFYQGGFEPGLRVLVEIKPHLDRFFDKVMVMAPDPTLRGQRLGLLDRLVGLFNSVADLSEIQTSAN